MAASGPKMADRVWKIVHLQVFGRSRHVLLNRFFDPSTPSMRKGDDREKKQGKKWGKKKRKKRRFQWPLTSLPVDRLTTTDCNANRSCQLLSSLEKLSDIYHLPVSYRNHFMACKSFFILARRRRCIGHRQSVDWQQRLWTDIDTSGRRSGSQLPTTLLATKNNFIFFFCHLLSLKECSDQKTYLTFSEPCQPFWIKQAVRSCRQ